MNADFERAFLKRFPHLDIVYDRFHLVRNFNEKVICKVRKDKQARLKEEGDAEAAHVPQALHIHPQVLCRYQGEEGARCTRRQGGLEGKCPLRQAGGPAEGRDQGALRGPHIQKNELPFACGIVDEMLALAYSYTDADAMERIVDTWRGHERQALRVVRPPRGEPHGRDRRTRQAPDLFGQG
ncbi:MAG: transposase [Coriobacteriaceae bacterium]